MYRQYRNLWHFSIHQNDPTLRCIPAKRDHVNSKIWAGEPWNISAAVKTCRTREMCKYLCLVLQLTVILRTRVVYELIADEVRSTKLAIRHIRRE